MKLDIPEDVLLVIACRSASQPLGDNSQILGHKCVVCGDSLQITKSGLSVLAEHPEATLFCNDHGIAFAEYMKQRQKLAGVALTNECKHTFENEKVVPRIADWYRNYRKENPEN